MDEKINEFANRVLDEAENIADVGQHLTLLTSALLEVACGREVFLILATQMGDLAAKLIDIFDNIVLATRDLTAGIEESKEGG
jgi:hypothetical protein